MPFNMREARQEILISAEAGNCVELISPSGIGKSQLARQVYEHLRDRDAPKGIRWGYGCVFAATQTPAGLDGLQYKGQREVGGRMYTVSDPSLPVWFVSDEGIPADQYDRFFLFVDEFGQAEGDVKKGFAEIFLHGRSTSHALPEGSVRIAASNEGTRYGVSKDFLFSISRRKRVEIEGNSRIWVEDFADHPYQFNGRTWNVSPFMKSWALRHPEIFFEKEPEKQGPWCNARTATAVDRELQVRAAMNGGKFPTDATTIEACSGIVGMPATQSIMQELAFRLELPQYADIVADPENTPMPARADLMMLLAYELAAQTEEQDLAACLKYMQRKEMPKDMQLTYVGALNKRDYMKFANQPAMLAWCSKNASLVTLLSANARQ